MSQRTSRHRYRNDAEPVFEKKKRKNFHPYPTNSRSARGIVVEKHFKCANCALLVATDRAVAGVNNRNHCPNCLWSRHVDLDKAGDRKAACKARMRPVGLTVKRTGKKYAGSKGGELMIIHQCAGCGKISINRIAADDSAGALLRLYRSSQELEDPLRLLLEEMSIAPLAAADLTTVYSQLFGWYSILGEFIPPQDAVAELAGVLSADATNEIHGFR